MRRRDSGPARETQPQMNKFVFSLVFFNHSCAGASPDRNISLTGTPVGWVITFEITLFLLRGLVAWLRRTAAASSSVCVCVCVCV